MLILLLFKRVTYVSNMDTDSKGICFHRDNSLYIFARVLAINMIRSISNGLVILNYNELTNVST